MQHPRVLKIKQKFKLNKKFSFRCVSEATVRKFVKSLFSDKATAGQSSGYIVKNGETYLLELTNWINEAIIKNKLPDSLKLSDATPAYKKLDPNNKASYRLHKIFSSVYFRNGRHSLTGFVILAQFPWIFVKHMTVYYMIYWLKK